MSKKIDATKYGWPSMWYHPETAHYKVCNSAEEVPDGWHDDPADCKTRPDGEIPQYRGTVPTPVYTHKRDTVKDTNVDDNDVDEVTALKAELAEAKAKLAAKSAVKDEKVSDDPIVVGDEDKEDDKAAVPSLKDLKITRSQAMTILKEENVDYGKTPKNEYLAGLVNKLLEKEKEEDVNSE